MFEVKKILVIGGACQGKTAWVEKIFPEYQEVLVDVLLQENKQGNTRENIRIQGFHILMKQWLSQGREYKEQVALLMKNPSWLIVSDEIGNGIVPIDKKEREWREETGRMLCELAKEADEVYRIYCGIPTKIKGCENK